MYYPYYSSSPNANMNVPYEYQVLNPQYQTTNTSEYITPPNYNMNRVPIELAPLNYTYDKGRHQSTNNRFDQSLVNTHSSDINSVTHYQNETGRGYNNATSF
ncbi:hypothetical protein CON42_18650 [Bacillus thuringiensis]|uniref:hypothetical protein n=1 Tax=Bacillus thuringiensis TaxID=1428 RepID=UPI000BEB7B29|nr:hypothetical protein [Bacillus thuringiensis]PEA13969.1 hypothetical protein CON42_18650 [Bacillus thuringiensis]PEE67862.1 hypothetical protein COM73_27315 [Bacillus thuringiensis]QFQ28788.1 hypothetical protein DDE73_29710 [Bacillus thuringiensis]HDR7164102.1 hypothetical protein [Bacillus cereus]